MYLFLDPSADQFFYDDVFYEVMFARVCLDSQFEIGCFNESHSQAEDVLTETSTEIEYIRTVSTVVSTLYRMNLLGGLADRIWPANKI